MQTDRQTEREPQGERASLLALTAAAAVEVGVAVALKAGAVLGGVDAEVAADAVEYHPRVLGEHHARRADRVRQDLDLRTPTTA